jgi:hypothetical protein
MRFSKDSIDLKDSIIFKVEEPMSNETVALYLLATDFCKKMLAKLWKAQKNGRTGWDNPQILSNESIKGNLYRSIMDEDWVSVANYAAMLWNREE